MSIARIMREIFIGSLIADGERQMLEDKCAAMALDADHLHALRIAAGLVEPEAHQPDLGRG